MELNKIHNMDCLEGMKLIEDNSIDICITSPPYFNAKEYSYWNSYEKYLEDMKEIFLKVYSVLKEGRMCCVNISTIIQPRENRNSESRRIPIPFHFVSLMESIGFKFLEDIIWVKPEGSARNRGGRFYQDRQPLQYKPNVVNEYILVFQKPIRGLIDKILKRYKKNENIYNSSLILNEYERTNIWKIQPVTKSLHSAPFPLEIPEKLIKYYSFTNDVVLDPFIGSGTTAIACKKLKRRYIGFEIDKNYYDLSIDRVNKVG